jgi:hypothetical protein
VFPTAETVINPILAGQQWTAQQANNTLHRFTLNGGDSGESIFVATTRRPHVGSRMPLCDKISKKDNDY